MTTPRLLRLVFCCAFAGLGCPAADADTFDVVRLVDKQEIRGDLVTLAPNAITIKDQADGETRDVAIEQVAEVLFGGEPEGLRGARSLLLRRQPGAALDEVRRIEQVEWDGASDLVLAEADFVRAAATGLQATLTGMDLDKGEQALRDFLQKHSRSHHVFESQHLLGELLVRAGRFDAAAAAFAALDKGPPAFKVRAAMAKAGALYERGKFADAEREYDTAITLATQSQDTLTTRQRRQAQAGRARCLAHQDQAADAVKIVQDMIRAADPEDRDLLGLAYTALGDAFRAAGKRQDAVIAFLTVDLVYNTDPDSHAEALYNLVQLWLESRNPERSREAAQALETSYPASRWTKALDKAGSPG